jgi:sporulation protein YlmC with PRC-barrel domain
VSDELDLALGLLDHQLLDCEGRRCGNVDDLAIEGGPGESPHVAAVLVGRDVLRSRSWVGRLVPSFGDRARVRVPWEEVADVGAHVELKKTAAEYGLGRGDDRVRPWIARLPGANR